MVVLEGAVLEQLEVTELRQLEVMVEMEPQQL
jgi:hypothetical protein